MTKYFIDDAGKYVGAFDGAEPPAGAIEVAEPPEHANDVRTGSVWVKTPARVADEGNRAQVKNDAFVQQFIEMSPAQVIAYVNSNVSNLADAKQLLTKLALMLLVVAKEQYRG